MVRMDMEIELIKENDADYFRHYSISTQLVEINENIIPYTYVPPVDDISSESPWFWVEMMAIGIPLVVCLGYYYKKTHRISQQVLESTISTSQSNPSGKI